MGRALLVLSLILSCGMAMSSDVRGMNRADFDLIQNVDDISVRMDAIRKKSLENQQKKGVLVAETENDELPEMLFLTASWCQPCKEVKDDIKDGKFKLFKMRIVDIENDKPPISPITIPAFWWRNADGKAWQYPPPELADEKRGYPGAIELTRIWKVTQSPRKQAANVRWTSCELRGFAATYRGSTIGVQHNNYWFHLQSSNHGFSATQLQGLNQNELAAIHGANHNGLLSPTH